MSALNYLPAGLSHDELAATIGLVSDTHMPERRRVLPSNLGEVLGGVELILHAGDVGELWVLDQLSAIAPIVAVHGNDDTPDATRELPVQQLITIAGQRILLWHSHFPNLEEEMASRRGDALPPKLQRSVDQGRRAGANIVVFGHWHIPLVYDKDDVIVVNPGALASGNEFTRMLRNTVAILYITTAGNTHIVHIDLADPASPFPIHIDWDAGFNAAAIPFVKSIIAPDLNDAVQHLRGTLSRAELMHVRPIVSALAMPIWENEGGELTALMVEEALVNTTELPAELKARILDTWFEWKQHQRNGNLAVTQ